MKLLSIYNALGPLLRPLGLPYAGAMKARRLLYERGCLAAYAPACPVVSVGNIAWGGSGKTPITGKLLGFVRSLSLRAAVLSRGYKADPGSAPLLVRRDSSPGRAGDEPLMLARAYPEAAIITFPDRAEAARYAEKRYHPDLIILDDGMQHLRVRRDIELVLLRPEDLEADWNRVIPAGPWREGAGALASASAFIVKADPGQFSSLESIAWQRLEPYGKPLFSFSMEPVGLRPLFPRGDADQAAKAGATERLRPEEYHDRAYVLVSGVGNPSGVEATAVRLMGRPPLQHFDFADHHAYSEADIQAVRKLLPAPLPVICTAKDAVKLGAFREAWDGAPVWSLETDVVFGPGLFVEHNFPAWFGHVLNEALAAKSRAPGGQL